MSKPQFPLTGSPEIDFQGSSRSQQKILERRLRRWIARFATEVNGQLVSSLPRVKVRLDTDESLVGCFVEVSLGGRTWSASWYGRNPAQALTYCLQHLVERRLVQPA